MRCLTYYMVPNRFKKDHFKNNDNMTTTKNNVKISEKLTFSGIIGSNFKWMGQF